MGNFSDDIKNEAKQYGGGGSSDYFQFDGKGVYKMRILCQPKVTATHFFGKGNPAVVCIGVDEGCQHHKADEKKPSIKLATYIIDRADGKIKMAELPLSLSYSLSDLQEDSDFAFEDFPMPYDVKVNYDPDNNDPKMIYRLVASPKQEPVTEEETATLSEKMGNQTPEQYVENKKKRQKEKSEGPAKAVEYPKENIDPEDIPF